MPLRPPFTGIHEILPLRGDPGLHEGGGPQPPYGEDIVNRIVDVNWGKGKGGLFVSGDHCCFFRYANIDKVTTDQDWYGLGSLAFGDGGIVESGSYAVVKGRPTFLMGGIGDYATLMLSHDGIEWVTILDDNHPRIYGIIWNEDRGRFYAQTAGYISSPDGYEWQPETMTYTEFIGMSRSGEADGIVGYDPKNNQLIHPDELNTSREIYMECTGFVGGVWMAGGEMEINGRWTSATLTSIDGGENWEIATYGPIGMNGDYSVVIMLAVPHSEL